MYKKLLVMCLLIFLIFSSVRAEQKGVEINYELPVEDELPANYRVTLAITDPERPERIITTFANGIVKEVTEENQGEFTETWDGLDDNYMPLPAGEYGVRGIYMPAEKWEVTGEYHTIIPQYLFSVGDSWMPKKEEEMKNPWISGHNFGPPKAIDTSVDGKAAFFWEYIENSHNPFLLDLNRDINYNQVLEKYESWGAAGGWEVATNGELVWAVTDNGGEQIIYRADREDFGNQEGAYRNNVTRPQGHVTSMAAKKNEQDSHLLYTAQRGKIIDGNKESTDKSINKIIIYDGEQAEILDSRSLKDPQSIQVSYNGQSLYALNKKKDGIWLINKIKLENGLFKGDWEQISRLELTEKPYDFQINNENHIYISFPEINQVKKFNLEGKKIFNLGKKNQQQPGDYDSMVFMSPHSLALWKDEEGEERLLVNERKGPYRISEWSNEGNLLREWFYRPGPQAQGHGDFVLDPQNPQYIYSTGPDGLIRAKMDIKNRNWEIDAVWPEISGSHFDPEIINFEGNKYLAVTGFGGTGNHLLYRKEGKEWLPSAGIIRDNDHDYFWNDENGDGKINEEEYQDRDSLIPNFRYWGEQWLDDLSITSVGKKNIFRIRPDEFDEHGNPIFVAGDLVDSNWEGVVTDPVLKAKDDEENDLYKYYAANELTDSFNIDWTKFASDEGDFYVNSPGGPDLPHNNVSSIGTVGNHFSQIKITRYSPDEKGNLKLQWRVGRKHFGNQIEKPGEMYGTMHINSPINDILGVHDAHGLYHLFTASGFYLDTLMVSAARPGYRGQYGPQKGGVYAHFNHDAGEFWTSTVHFEYDGEVYLAMGRNYVNIYKLKNYPLKEDVYHYIDKIDENIEIKEEQIAEPKEAAEKLRE
ncbi:MAG: hypothetical protein ACOC1S_00955 [bacterium]